MNKIPNKHKIEETKGINLFNTNKPQKIDLDTIIKKFEILYDEKNDIINIKCKSNVLFEFQNSIFISKNDTVILTGDALGAKGKIYLNPVLQRFRAVYQKVKDVFSKEKYD